MTKAAMFARMGGGGSRLALATAAIAGVFSRVRCGPVDVFLLDERYYRGVEAAMGMSRRIGRRALSPGDRARGSGSH